MLDSKDWLELAYRCKAELIDQELDPSYKLGYAKGFIDGLIEYLEVVSHEEK